MTKAARYEDCYFDDFEIQKCHFDDFDIQKCHFDDLTIYALILTIFGNEIIVLMTSRASGC